MRISFNTILTAFSFYISLHAQIPNGYYNLAENKSDQALRSALHNIIDDHIDYPYSSSSTDTWDILKDADADPNNANNVILIYTRESVNGHRSMMVGIENMFGQSQEVISALHVQWVLTFTTCVPVTSMLILHVRIIVLMIAQVIVVNRPMEIRIVALHLFSNP